MGKARRAPQLRQSIHDFAPSRYSTKHGLVCPGISILMLDTSLHDNMVEDVET